MRFLHQEMHFEKRILFLYLYSAWVFLTENELPCEYGIRSCGMDYIGVILGQLQHITGDWLTGWLTDLVLGSHDSLTSYMKLFYTCSSRKLSNLWIWWHFWYSSTFCKKSMKVYSPLSSASKRYFISIRHSGHGKKCTQPVRPFTIC